MLKSPRPKRGPPTPKPYHHGDLRRALIDAALRLAEGLVEVVKVSGEKRSPTLFKGWQKRFFTATAKTVTYGKTATSQPIAVIPITHIGDLKCGGGDAFGGGGGWSCAARRPAFGGGSRSCAAKLPAFGGGRQSSRGF